LKIAEQIKNEFLATITHELRTPLNGIIGLIYTLLETSLKPNQLDTVNLLHSICLKMETIINNSIDYSKLANNNIILEQREFDFQCFMDKVVSMNSESIEEKGLKLIVNVAEDIPKRVVGDEFRLTQILNNIISNAIKFTSVGQIAIEVAKIAQDSTHVELFFMVIDTGIGIAPEEMDRLFQSFTQVDGSFTRRYGGTGVGLSISKLLIEAMNGTITVESEKDQGSIFSFNIYLGLPKENEETTVHESFYYNSDLTSFGESVSEFPEVKYISRILDEVTQFNQKSELFTVFNSLDDNFAQQDFLVVLFYNI
jgi:signal transduction histidine kinase